jgi:hypothetical protein
MESPTIIKLGKVKGQNMFMRAGFEKANSKKWLIKEHRNGKKSYAHYNKLMKCWLVELIG